MECEAGDMDASPQWVLPDAWRLEGLGSSMEGVEHGV